MFKFVSKSDDNTNESALFHNGQRIYTIYTGVYSDGEMFIQVEDGSGKLMHEWEDYLEESD